MEDTLISEETRRNKQSIYNKRSASVKSKKVDKTVDMSSRRSDSIDIISDDLLEEIQDEFDESQYNMLGSNKTVLQKVTSALSHPKFFTSLYNINGR